MHHVYRLIDPRDHLPFYVGITNNPNIRYVQHCAPDEESAKADLIASIREDGFEPIFEIRESYKVRQIALEREAYWINYYFDHGIKLVNIRKNLPQTTQPKQDAKHHTDNRKEQNRASWQASFVERGETWICMTLAFPAPGTEMLHLADEYGLTKQVCNHTTYYRESELEDFRAWVRQIYYQRHPRPKHVGIL